MQLTVNPYILLPLFAMIMALILCHRGWRYHTAPLGKTFLVLMLALAWWSFSVVMEHLSLDLAAKFIWIKMSYFGIAVVPVGWLIFTLVYTERGRWLTRRNIAVLAILPVLTIIMVWTNGVHYLMWKDIWLDTSLSPPVDAVTHNTWFWIQAGYAYLLILLGTLCLLSLFRQSGGIYRKQAVTLLSAAIVPWIANILFIGGVSPFSVVDFTPLAFAITGIAFFWGLSRFKLLDIMPIAYDTILKNMVDGIIVLDNQKRIIELNLAAQKIIGRRRSEVIGQSYILPGQLGLLELPLDMNEAKGSIIIEEGQEQRQYSVSISIIRTQQHPSGYLFILHDDTERVKAEVEARERAILETELIERKVAQEKLEKSEEKYSTIVEKGNDGIIIIQDGIVKFANSKNTEISGYSHDEIIGRPLLEFISPDHRESMVDTVKRKISGEPIPNKFELDMLTKDGSTKSVEITTNGINYEGSPADIAIIRDITERKQLEAKTIEMRALKQTNQVRSELLANVSHELRTPLTSIKGFIETLIEPDVEWSKKQQLDFLQSANKEADHLTLLIKDLLDMSRIDSGKLTLDKRSYQVKEIIDSASGVLSIIAAKHQMKIASFSDLPPIQTDKSRIVQVITNMVENAVKFSPEGSQIVLEAKLNENNVIISVADHGIGMPPEVVANLFNRFYQAQQVVTGKTKGTGLGLSICKGIVEAHGGEIWVESQERKGSKFSFSIPVNNHK